MNRKLRARVIKAVVIGVGVVIVVAVAYKLLNRNPGPPEVQILTLRPGKIVSTVSADGELEAFNQVDISAEIVAKVVRVNVKEGDEVEKGRLLCVLYDGDLRSQRDLSRAQYEQARATYERGKALFEEKLISEADFDERRTSFEVARAQLEQSQDDLGKTRIYAPISGRVVRVDVEVGETVVMGTMNNAGTVMFTLGDLSALQAKVYADEADVVSVAPGQPAVLTFDALPDVPFKARVNTISYMPNVDGDAAANGVTEFEVTLDLLDVNAALRPGMSVSAEITTAVREDVITCPLQALGRNKAGGRLRDTVFVLDNGRTKLVPVETGISDGINVEITSGLKAGQVVVAGPYKTLRVLTEGEEVTAVERDEEWLKETKPGPGRPGRAEGGPGRR